MKLGRKFRSDRRMPGRSDQRPRNFGTIRAEQRARMLGAKKVRGGKWFRTGVTPPPHHGPSSGLGGMGATPGIFL